MGKRLFIKTYGCQMNVYDSQRIAESLAPLGYEVADEVTNADLVILNTCHIREKAAEKVYSDLGRLRRIREERRSAGSDLEIAVAGCVAQAEGDALMRRAPQVDIVVGPQSYHRLPELLARRARQGIGQLDTSFPLESKFDELPDRAARSPVSAFLSIQEGCDKFCTFCVVPYTRGVESSRPVDAILAEARQLVAGGAREIVLLGQNVNAFHGEGPDGRSWSLSRLLADLAELPGLLRLRYTTSHPRDVDDDLIRSHGQIPALMPFLHLPVQTGSDRVLEGMNRGYSATSYIRLVERLRAARPDLAMSSDFIVGFPGEDEADFEATLSLVREVGFAQCFSFKYSRRPGTPASGMRRQVAEEVKNDRLERLQALLAEQSARFNGATVGRTVPVLFERAGRHAGQHVGRSPYLQAVHVVADGLAPGVVEDVRIESCHAHSLGGSVVAGGAQMPERAA